ncbi:protein MODIFIER OF SNC1 11-like [Impatiens glandulifera]|uniref:protein MODIFIER OF SNC1 11-like n=1 Tax=Impatiens glandulifera TaxID=253017 RepID=UPI001FB0B543|nr:protein MODIFIER OF SNC1 11-like [Impatiens glandulifera]
MIEARGGIKTDSVVSLDKGEIPVTTDIEEKIRRAERFGVPVQLSEHEKHNTRVERFGTTSTTSESVKYLEDQKRKTRTERFYNICLGLMYLNAADEAKKKVRLERFVAAPNTTTTTTTTTIVEDGKRKAKIIRFSQPTASISQVNGERDKVVNLSKLHYYPLFN